MRKPKYYLALNAEETRLVLQSLIRMKNRLIAQGRYTDCVDELIAKIAKPSILFLRVGGIFHARSAST